MLQKITNAPWYVTNKILYEYIELSTVKHIIMIVNDNVSKMESQQNKLALNLLNNADTVWHPQFSTCSSDLCELVNFKMLLT